PIHQAAWIVNMGGKDVNTGDTTMTELGRRDFLKSLGAGLILGLPLLEQFARAGKEGGKSGAPQPPPAPPGVLAAGRTPLEDEVKPGVIVVIPADRLKAEELANSVARLLGARDATCALHEAVGRKGWEPTPVGVGDLGAKILFCEAVFVCLPAE